VTGRRRYIRRVRIAALDLGTNSFHLLVAEVRGDGGFDPLVREKEMLRLGDTVALHGSIPELAADRAVATVRRFRLLADAAGADEIVACATSAIRVAANGDELVDRIESETGVDVRVIDGLTEAQLIFRAIRASVLLDPAPALCFDLGGGSVEIMVGDAAGLHWAASENLGVGRLTAELVESDPLSKEDRRRLRDRIESVLGPVAATVAHFEPKLVVGTSGTLEDLAHMVAARRREDVPTSLNQLTISRAEFLPLHKLIISSKASERRRLEGLESRRVDLIPAGSMFLATVMELFDFDELTVSEWALREGILLDAIGHHDPVDWTDDPRAIRRASVQGLARRYDIDVDHSRQVARLALALFDQTTELHGLSAHDRELLEYAALLHNIGQHVSSEGHHRHAAYLIRYGQLRGFDPTEVNLLAGIARWHRKGDPRPTDETGPLAADDEDRLRKLTALLRVADGLDRSHHDIVDDVHVRVGPSLVRVYLDAGGNVELEQWAARRRRSLFEKVFDRELELTTHPAGRLRSAVSPADLPPSGG
jgi:exopolyphosphatase/guanosine-5'-triphosphate,3'-diphosphate pyrophosphatase